MGASKVPWDELAPEQKAALIRYYSKTNKQEIEEMAKAKGPYPVESLWGEGTFRDTGRKSTMGESIDSLVGAPARAGLDELVDPAEQPRDMFDYGPQAVAIMKRMGRAFGADPREQPTGFDVASKVTDNPYAGTALATAIDVGAQLPLPMGAGIAGTVERKMAPEAKAILAKIKTPEQATKLKGAAREKYLEALTEVYGDKAKRSASMGFGEEPLFHGSPNKNIEKFKESPSGGSSGKYGSGVYLTNSADYADQFAGADGKIYELRSRNPNKPFAPHDLETAESVVENYGIKGKRPRLLRSGEQGMQYLEKNIGHENITDALEKAGLRMHEDFGLPGTLADIRVDRPQYLRSVDAAFDPRFKDSDLLLAGRSGVPLDFDKVAISKAIEERKKRRKTSD